MDTRVTLRNVPLCHELLHYARRCCEGLAPLLGNDARCELLIARGRGQGWAYVARVALPDLDLSPTYEADPDPYLAVRNAVAVLQGRLSPLPITSTQRRTAQA